jgi:hypothetical protein
MDTVLDGLSEADQRRVYLCGQRIAAGMSPKVIPPLNEKGKENETKHRAANRPAKGGKTAQAGSSVGTSPRPERQSKKGRDSKHEK